MAGIKDIVAAAIIAAMMLGCTWFFLDRLAESLPPEKSIYSAVSIDPVVDTATQTQRSSSLAASSRHNEH